MILLIKSWRIKKKFHKPGNWRPGPNNSLGHADNRKYFSGLSVTWNWREAHMFYLAREVGRIWRCSCWEKGNFIMINEITYRQTWKIRSSLLSLLLYCTEQSDQNLPWWKSIEFTHCAISLLKIWSASPHEFIAWIVNAFSGHNTHYNKLKH